MIEKLGIFFGDFFQAYGGSFLIMILAGFCVAFVVELSVKKAFAWLEEKFAGRDKLMAFLSMVKMGAIFTVTIVLTLISTKLIVGSGLPLPGNAALAPFWFVLIYAAQYVFSMYGIKGIISAREKGKLKKAEKQPKEKKEKVNPVAGYVKISNNCYKDPETGNFYNKKGEQL